jgi:rhamnose utilization protein RhaD (predicted bifunctional aldolase and dehydrogenase)
VGIQELVSLSRLYGANPDFVIAGGGNTSFKDSDYLYIKASGTSLATIEPAGFVKLSRQKLDLIGDRRYSRESDAREAEILADMMAAREPGEESKRPSVETPMHAFIPFTYVVHTHPALVNGLTCGADGRERAARLFGGEALWIESVNPGYVLSMTVLQALSPFRSGTVSGMPRIIFLQNHGVVVSGDSPEEITSIYDRIVRTLRSAVTAEPEVGLEPLSRPDEALVERFTSAIRNMFAEKAGSVAFHLDRETERLIADRVSFGPVAGAFTPDHIVYAGHEPMFVEADPNPAAQERLLSEALEAYRSRSGGIDPRIIAVRGTGVFSWGANETVSRLGIELFRDAVKVATYAKSFGGPRFMAPDQVAFINNWEVERYRKQVSQKGR